MDRKDPEEIAENAGLCYVSSDLPGYQRKPYGQGFTYFDEETENRVGDKRKLKYFKKLAIPPAWEDVWICKNRNGHLLATGYDQKGRKQYIYNPDWQELRNTKKYEKLHDFGLALPAIRSRVKKDLTRDGLPREKIMATIVSMMEESMVRIGNKSYAKRNNSYGLTTLRKKHVEIHGADIDINFTGKSGKEGEVHLEDGRIAEIIRECHELPGYKLFKYFDEEGNKQYADSADVNEYIHEISGDEFTAKFFRTWGGSVRALEEYDAVLKEENDSKKLLLTQVIERVSSHLNNTVSICRDYYVHPYVLSIIEDERPIDLKDQKIEIRGLDRTENYLMNLIVD